MMNRSQMLARVALFAALAYVLAYASVFIPNVSLIYIVFFASGVLYGLRMGIMIAGVGEFIWTIFNPYGMAPVTTTISQIIAMMLIGALGAVFFHSKLISKISWKGFTLFAVNGLLAGLIFQVVLTSVDAWLYGPFWQYLMAGLGFAVLNIVSNGVIFPVFYPVVVQLAKKEYAR